MLGALRRIHPYFSHLHFPLATPILSNNWLSLTEVQGLRRWAVFVVVWKCASLMLIIPKRKRRTKTRKEEERARRGQRIDAGLSRERRKSIPKVRHPSPQSSLNIVSM